jgi:citrate synthase
MMNTLLTVCLEHSLNSPSVDAPIFVASSGVPLQAAVSAGVAAMGDWHGGAIEEAAKMLQEATAVQYKSIQELPGFYVYGKIPVEGFLASDTLLTRVIRVRNDCWNSLMKQNYLVRMSRWRLRFELTEKFYGKHLILNVDGCIAAIISDMGFDWRLAKDSS